MNQELDQQLELPGLIVKSYHTELSDEEQRRLQQWLDASPRNRQLYESGKKGRSSEKQQIVHFLHRREGWERIESEIRSRSLWRRWLPYAACVLVALGGIGIWEAIDRIDRSFHLVTDNQDVLPGSSRAKLIGEDGKVIAVMSDEAFCIKQVDEGVVLNNENSTLKVESIDSIASCVSYKTLDVPIGGEYKLVLNDGTTVWLNSDSRLRFPASFGRQARKVYLEGEACFDVAPDSKHPFIVAVGDMDVCVLGTLFNVKAYASDGEIYTTLARGAVRTVDRRTDRSLLLEPDQQCIYRKANGQMEARQVDARVYLGWSRGHFVFENERLEEIMKQLERWYDIQVFYQNAALKDYRFTGDIDRLENISAVLELLGLTRQVKFELKNKTVVIGR